MSEQVDDWHLENVHPNGRHLTADGEPCGRMACPHFDQNARIWY